MLLFGITVLNIVGVSIIGKLQKVIVLVVLVALLVLATMGLQTMDVSYLKGGFSKGANGFIAAAAFVYVSYAGVTKVAAIAEEVKNPDRNLPLRDFDLVVQRDVYLRIRRFRTGHQRANHDGLTLTTRAGWHGTHTEDLT